MRRLPILLVLLMLCCTLAHARAGGGQTYSRPASTYHAPPVNTYHPPTRTEHTPSDSHHTSSTTYHPPSNSTPADTSTSPSYGSSSTSEVSVPYRDDRARNAFVGIVVAVVILAIILFLVARQLRRSPDVDLSVQAEQEWDSAQKALAALRNDDPNFSEPVFTDYVMLLYARLHDARGKGTLDSLRAFVGPDVLEQLGREAHGRQLTAVDEVVVGGITIEKATGFDPPKDYVRVVVSVTANYTEHAGEKAKRWFVSDRLSLTRQRGVVSKSPEDMRAFACPSCGAPSETRPDGTCPYCDRPVATGEYQWVLVKFERGDETELPKVDVTQVAPEAGTDLPDLRPRDFAETRKAFHDRHPDFDEEAFEAKARDCFMRVQKAWSSGRWADCRPVVSDAVYDRNRYWIDLYAARGLTNRLDDITIDRVAPIRFDQDAFYDAITVRIHATMRDYFVDRAGQVVGGDSKRPRRFSEYWTFLRRSDFDPAKAAHPSGCPHCGAPLEGNATSACAHCGTKINSGHFDWVLTKIEQDEDYTPA